MINESWHKARPGEPDAYRITVEGSLDPTWTNRLGGMQISSSERPDQMTVTTLCGPVSDQAALLGVLNSLYQLHMRILSVVCEAREPMHGAS